MLRVTGWSPESLTSPLQPPSPKFHSGKKWCWAGRMSVLRAPRRGESPDLSSAGWGRAGRDTGRMLACHTKRQPFPWPKTSGAVAATGPGSWVPLPWGPGEVTGTSGSPWLTGHQEGSFELGGPGHGLTVQARLRHRLVAIKAPDMLQKKICGFINFHFTAT